MSLPQWAATHAIALHIENKFEEAYTGAFKVPMPKYGVNAFSRLSVRQSRGPELKDKLLFSLTNSSPVNFYLNWDAYGYLDN